MRAPAIERDVRAAARSLDSNPPHLAVPLSRAATIGFNCECVEYRKMIFSLWDLGGSQDARPFWRMYYANTQAIIFVIDSSDLDRMVRTPLAAHRRRWRHRAD